MSLNLYAVCNILYVAKSCCLVICKNNPVAFCGNILCRIGAVEDYAHLTPFSALGVIYCVAHNTLWNIGKICKAVGCCSSRIRECRKSVTDFIKTSVIFNYIWIEIDIFPVKHIFFSAWRIAVFVTVFTATKLLTAEWERNTLWSNNNCRRKLVHCNKIFISFAIFTVGTVNRADKLIVKTKVIVTWCICYALWRNICPACCCVTLSCYTCFQVGSAWTFLNKSTVRTACTALDCITDCIIKRTDAVAQLLEIFLTCQYCAFVTIGCHIPCLTVHKNLTAAAVCIKIVKCGTNWIHSCYIMKSHKVEAETVNVIFACPICNGINHILSEHKMFTCCIVWTARTVWESSVIVHSVVIIRNCSLKPRIRGIGVVIDNIHNYTDSGIMKCLNHLLTFLDSHFTLFRICWIRTLGAVVVDGIVAPVVLVHNVLALVNRTEIIERHNLHILNAELFQIVNAGWWRTLNTVDCCTFFGKSKVLATVSLTHAAWFGWWKVCYRDFPDRRISLILYKYMLIIFPTIGIGCA